MKQNHSQVSAYVLHTRSFQENSQIIQLFSYQLGRFSIIAKGIKGKRSQSRKATLQPFVELNIEFTGKGELKTLIHCEPTSTIAAVQSYSLQGTALACGYYANELLIRSIPQRHEYSEVFVGYRELIEALKNKQEMSPLLRNFEVILLTAIGIAPDWQYDVDQNPIESIQQYIYLPQNGFKLVKPAETHVSEPSQSYNCNTLAISDLNCYCGQAILSLGSGRHETENLKKSQQITRLLLREVIGDKPLQSRKMWQQINLNTK